MLRRIRAVVYGLGEMSSRVLGLLLEKDVEIVGAIGKGGEAGRDLGEVAGLGIALGLDVAADAASVLAGTAPDIAVVATEGDPSGVGQKLGFCAQAGVDAITLADGALHPWWPAGEERAGLDALAKRTGATLLGGEEVYSTDLVATLLGSAHRVTSVDARISVDVDELGPDFARGHQVGKSATEFGLWLRGAERPPSPGCEILEAIAAQLGLTVERSHRTTRPLFAEIEMRSESLGLYVRPGAVIGLVDRDTVVTAEGPRLGLELATRLHRDGEMPTREWRVRGEPDLDLLVPSLDTRAVACARLVNRIPDVIDAPPGLIAPTELAAPRFRPGPLQVHVRSLS